MQIVKANTAKPTVTKLFIGEFVGKKSRKVKIVTIAEQDLAKVKSWVEEQLSKIVIEKTINVLEKPTSTGYVMMRNQQGSKVIGKSVSLTTYYLDLATAYKAITGEDLPIEEVKEVAIEAEKTEEINMTEAKAEEVIEEPKSAIEEVAAEAKAPAKKNKRSKK